MYERFRVRSLRYIISARKLRKRSVAVLVKTKLIDPTESWNYFARSRLYLWKKKRAEYETTTSEIMFKAITESPIENGRTNGTFRPERCPRHA